MSNDSNSFPSSVVISDDDDDDGSKSGESNKQAFLVTPVDQRSLTQEQKTTRVQVIEDIDTPSKPGFIVDMAAMISTMLQLPAEDGSANALLMQVLTKVEDLQTTVAGLQDDKVAQAHQITVLQAANATQERQISALQAANTTQERQISALQAANTTQERQISALQAANIALETTNATQERQISILQTTNVEQARLIASLQDDKIDNASLIANLRAEIADVRAANTTLEGRIATLSAQNQTLTTITIPNLQAVIDSKEDRIKILEANVKGIKAQVNYLREDHVKTLKLTEGAYEADQERLNKIIKSQSKELHDKERGNGPTRRNPPGDRFHNLFGMFLGKVESD